MSPERSLDVRVAHTKVLSIGENRQATGLSMFVQLLVGDESHFAEALPGNQTHLCSGIAEKREPTRPVQPLHKAEPLVVTRSQA